MSTSRYPQTCALARAAEVVGGRWTLLIVRELLLGPKRFTDLRERLDGVSPSVLAERLARMEEGGLVAQRTLDPPAASTVYELTEDGAALRPAVYALIRWGARLLFPPRPGERFEPDWIRLVLEAYARSGPSPRHSFNVHVREGEKVAVVHVAGGRGGTSVAPGPAPADATVIADPITLLGLMSGGLDPASAVAGGNVQVEGDAGALSLFPQLFETQEV